TLENPRFAGTTEDGQPFVVTAKSALPDGAVPNRIELDAPTGEVRLGDGLVLTVTSQSGEMLRKEEELHLTGTVTLITSNGYRVVTELVELDLSTKSAIVPGRVEADGPQGGISADSMEVHQTGENTRALTARFEGNVRVIFQPSDE
ncbi:MAG: LPS export ABC transporter periplasmic protein LptC, partial [Pseudomonadota bacterium]